MSQKPLKKCRVLVTPTSYGKNDPSLRVRLEEEGKTTVGQAADTDTLVASANAYLNALNKMIIKRKKTAPDEHQQQKNYQQQKMKGI